MVSEEDISLQKYQNYHNAYLLLLLSWVAVPPWVTINFDQITAVLSNLTPTKIGVIIFLQSLYTLALAIVWNRCIETEAAIRAKCNCSS